MTKCPVCQKDNPQGVEYCEDCGASLTPSREPATVGASPASAAAPAASATPPAAPAASGAASAAPSGGMDGASPSLAPESEASPSASPSPSTGTGSPDGSAMPQATPDSTPAAAPAAAATGAQQPRLLVRRFGALTGDEIPLHGERLVVGRFDPETGPVDIDLGSTPESEHISRQHAELYRETDGRWFVKDLGSTNGVFAKGGDQSSFGPRVTEPRSLADGDELAFGNARFIFKLT